MPKLRPPAGLLFIPQVIYKNEEPWWNDISSGNLLICPPELSGNPTSSHQVAKKMEREKGNDELAL
jgi:hypothetical protein